MIRNLSWIPLLSVLVTGCGGKYFEHRDPKDIPEGPGLFTGQEGAIVFSTDKKPSKPGPTTIAAVSAEPASFEEFREFQEFRRWHSASKDTAEFREFQDWREWRVYRSWKERQAK